MLGWAAGKTPRNGLASRGYLKKLFFPSSFLCLTSTSTSLLLHATTTTSQQNKTTRTLSSLRLRFAGMYITPVAIKTLHVSLHPPRSLHILHPSFLLLLHCRTQRQERDPHRMPTSHAVPVAECLRMLSCGDILKVRSVTIH